MPQATLDDAQIKALFKEALVELLQERKDLFHELVEDIMEDLGLLRAIKEGEGTPNAPRSEVFQVLEGGS